jgi:hypothetical protein
MDLDAQPYFFQHTIIKEEMRTLKSRDFDDIRSNLNSIGVGRNWCPGNTALSSSVVINPR